jgi:type I restriction enzyme R subunit
VLTRNPGAVQVGLTATPRRLAEKLGALAETERTANPWETPGLSEGALLAAESSAPYRVKGGAARGTVLPSKEARDDAAVCADNLRYFGAPAYEYDMAQAIEDGYLAACEIRKGRVDLDETGITLEEILALHPTDALTGSPVTREQLEERYEKTQFEDRILLPDRVQAMCQDLFGYLLDTGGPEQKTIIFCARDRHADDVAVCLNNLYARWCAEGGRQPKDFYAFKCTAAASGNDQLPDLRGSLRSHFVATTVELLTTGVDVPCVRNVVFFKYLKSPISFYQMVGRGTRVDPASDKLMFRVYDYTDATRLFGEEFVTKPRAAGGGDDPPPPPPPPEPTISVEGFDVHVTDAGRFIVAQVDGRALPVPLEDYKARLAARLVAQAGTLQDFRRRWVDPPARQELLEALVGAGYSPSLVRLVDEKEDYDLYDVLAELGWGVRPRTRQDRTLAFTYKHEDWLDGLPAGAATIKAIARQFERGGTEGLENPQVFQTPEVKAAGGLAALQAAGAPAELLRETKRRMFAA